MIALARATAAELSVDSSGIMSFTGDYVESAERGNTFTMIPASELDNWVKAAAPLYDDFVSDMDKKGLPGKQMLQDARDLLVKYKK